MESWFTEGEGGGQMWNYDAGCRINDDDDDDDVEQLYARYDLGHLAIAKENRTRETRDGRTVVDYTNNFGDFQLPTPPAYVLYSNELQWSLLPVFYPIRRPHDIFSSPRQMLNKSIRS